MTVQNNSKPATKLPGATAPPIDLAGLGLVQEDDAVRLLGVKVQTVRKWAVRRKGPPRVKIGKKVYYRRESLSAWIAAQEIDPAAVRKGAGDHAPDPAAVAPGGGGPERGRDLVGRDPRTITPEAWAATGIVPASPIKAIRAKCLDCCCGQLAEVRRCMALECSLWPFRMGVNVFHASCAAGLENPSNGAAFAMGDGDPTEGAGCTPPPSGLA